MGIKYNEFKEIFKEINKSLEEGNMKESDVIETIKNKLETEYPDVCREWGNDDFNINYLFFSESYGRYTLLYIAVKNGYKEIVKALLKVKKIDVNAQDRGNDAPLHPAAEQGHADVVALLLDKGADVKAETKGYYSSGYTSLHLAAKQGHADVVELLLDKGADAKAETKGCFSGYTSLHLAAKQGHADVVALLLDKGADAKAETKGYPSGYTSLHLAAEQGHAGVVALLLDKGADVKAETKDYSPGYTPLHLAAKQGHADVVALLLDKGADVKAETKDYFRYTPLELAKRKDHKKVVQLLEKAISQGSSQASPAAPSPSPQGAHHQPNGKGNMLTYNNLTAEQKKLYDGLEVAMEKEEGVSDILRSMSKDDTQNILTTANIPRKLFDGREDTVTPLGYALPIPNNHMNIDVILAKAQEVGILLKVFTTANITIKHPGGGRKDTVTPLGYALSIKNGYVNSIDVILAKIETEGILQEVLTTANITIEHSSGRKDTVTPLGYALSIPDNHKNIDVILEKAQEKGILQDILTSSITMEYNDEKRTITLLEYVRSIEMYRYVNIIEKK